MISPAARSTPGSSGKALIWASGNALALEKSPARAAAIAGSRHPRASVGIHDGAQHDASLVRAGVSGAAMHGRALVPHQHVADTPVVVIDESSLGRGGGEFLGRGAALLARHAGETVGVHGVRGAGREAVRRVFGAGGA